ncbi:MAG: XdhC family protein [Rhodospirillaceae bacterium]|jgi:xanthine dehydrogenase accessory factor|nr:XdhC family protein [Rhodospirillaceae bacterium]
MKTKILNDLLAARDAKSATVLITDIDTGAQSLVVDGAATGDISITSDITDAIDAVMADDRGKTVDIGGKRLFVRAFNPPKRLIIIGAVHIAQPLVPMARLAGFEPIVVDPRGAWATPERFPDVTIDSRWPDDAMADLDPDSGTAVVALTHDPKLDDPALAAALRSKAFYIGALGGMKSVGKRRERLSEEGFGEADFARIHGPVGLDIGAISPAEIALSILGEITQTRRRYKLKKAA